MKQLNSIFSALSLAFFTAHAILSSTPQAFALRDLSAAQSSVKLAGLEETFGPDEESLLEVVAGGNFSVRLYSYGTGGFHETPGAIHAALGEDPRKKSDRVLEVRTAVLALGQEKPEIYCVPLSALADHPAWFNTGSFSDHPALFLAAEFLEDPSVSGEEIVSVIREAAELQKERRLGWRRISVAWVPPRTVIPPPEAQPISPAPLTGGQTAPTPSPVKKAAPLAKKAPPAAPPIAEKEAVSPADEVEIELLTFPDLIQETLDPRKAETRSSRTWNRLVRRFTQIWLNDQKPGLNPSFDLEARKMAQRAAWKVAGLPVSLQELGQITGGQTQAAALSGIQVAKKERLSDARGVALSMAVISARVWEAAHEMQQLGVPSYRLPEGTAGDLDDYLKQFRAWLIADMPRTDYRELPINFSGFTGWPETVDLGEQSPFGISSILAVRQLGQVSTIRSSQELMAYLLENEVTGIEYLPPAPHNPPGLRILFARPLTDPYTDEEFSSLTVALLTQPWPDLPPEPEKPWKEMSEEEFQTVTGASASEELRSVEFSAAQVEPLSFQPQDAPGQKTEKLFSLIRLAEEGRLIARSPYMVTRNFMREDRTARWMTRTAANHDATRRFIRFLFENRDPRAVTGFIPKATPESKRKQHEVLEARIQAAAFLSAVGQPGLALDPAASARAVRVEKKLSTPKVPFRNEEWDLYRPLIAMPFTRKQGDWLMEEEALKTLLNQLEKRRPVLQNAEVKADILRVAAGLSGPDRQRFLEDLNDALLQALLKWQGGELPSLDLSSPEKLMAGLPLLLEAIEKDRLLQAMEENLEQARLEAQWNEQDSLEQQLEEANERRERERQREERERLKQQKRNDALELQRQARNEKRAAESKQSSSAEAATPLQQAAARVLAEPKFQPLLSDEKGKGAKKLLTDIAREGWRAELQGRVGKILQRWPESSLKQPAVQSSPEQLGFFKELLKVGRLFDEAFNRPASGEQGAGMEETARERIQPAVLKGIPVPIRIVRVMGSSGAEVEYKAGAKWEGPGFLPVGSIWHDPDHRAPQEAKIAWLSEQIGREFPAVPTRLSGAAADRPRPVFWLDLPITADLFKGPVFREEVLYRRFEGTLKRFLDWQTGELGVPWSEMIALAFHPDWDRLLDHQKLEFVRWLSDRLREENVDPLDKGTLLNLRDLFRKAGREKGTLIRGFSASGMVSMALHLRSSESNQEALAAVQDAFRNLWMNGDPEQFAGQWRDLSFAAERLNTPESRAWIALQRERSLAEWRVKEFFRKYSGTPPSSAIVVAPSIHRERLPFLQVVIRRTLDSLRNRVFLDPGNLPEGEDDRLDQWRRQFSGRNKAPAGILFIGSSQEFQEFRAFSEQALKLSPAYDEFMSDNPVLLIFQILNLLGVQLPPEEWNQIRQDLELIIQA